MNEAAVVEAIAAELEIPPAHVRPEGEFEKDYGVDSLDFVRLVMAVEIAAGVRIEDKLAAKARTVGQLLDLARQAPPSAE